MFAITSDRIEDYADSLRLLLEALSQEVRVAGDGVAGVAQALQPAGVRLVALSGYADAETCRLALRCTFEAVLKKPAPLDMSRRASVS
jgi:hypothetical protein